MEQREEFVINPIATRKSGALVSWRVNSFGRSSPGKRAFMFQVLICGGADAPGLLHNLFVS